MTIPPMPDIMPPPDCGWAGAAGAGLLTGAAGAAAGLEGPLLKNPPPPPELLPPDDDLPPPLGILFLFF